MSVFAWNHRAGRGTGLRLSVAAVVAAGALVGCAAEPEPVERLPRPVRAVQVEATASTVERSFSGVVQAPARSNLSFRVPGRVIARPIDIGSQLKKGRLIAELDPTDFRLRVEQAQADAERAQAGFREAKAEYARIQALYADDHATRRELDRALAAFERAGSEVEQAEKRLKISRRELAYTRLNAPESGLITDLFSEVGENVGAGQAVVAFIDQTSPLEVEWAVPAGWIGRFQPGEQVVVELPDLSFEKTPATVVDVGSAPRNGGVLFPVVARLGEASSRVRPGMAAEVRVRLAPDSTPDGGLAKLPPHAVIGDPEGYFVFVVESSSDDSDRRTVERRAVTVGRMEAEGLEILSGLEVGETVVAAGAGFLEHGQEVRLLRGDPLAELPSTAVGSGAAP